MQRKKARKAGGWGSEIKGWDTQKGGGLIIKGGGSYPSAHCAMGGSWPPAIKLAGTTLYMFPE